MKDIDLSDDAIGHAGMAYVLGSLDHNNQAVYIPPNGFSYKGMRKAIKAYFEYLERLNNE